MKKTSLVVLLSAGLALVVVPPLKAAAPELVIVNGRIVTGEASGTVREALAVREGRIVAVGTTREISRLADVSTQTVDLEGKMVLPGLYEAHVHARRASLAYLRDPHQELRTITEIQEWVRQRAREVPTGEWIRIPRNEITRSRERRHPTVAELDAACTTHPVVFDAVRKLVLNTRGFRELGITEETKSVPGGEIIRGANGRLRFLVTSSPQLTSRFAARDTATDDQKREALLKLHRAYNAAGITTIFERGSLMDEYRVYEKLQSAGLLSVRTRFTMFAPFKTAEDVESFVKKENIRPGHGDDWLSIGTLKIMADGGIHWGNTRLSEPYGAKRTEFYGHSDPAFRGDMTATDEQMRAVFGAAARLGWQMIVHVTGDGGVDAVLRAMEAVNKEVPLQGKRFMLTHAYFPSPGLAARAGALGMGVDTQAYTFLMDAPFINDIYGPEWAERFIGLGHWARGGVPAIISSDHMVGYDPDHSMNSYNPFIGLYAAVSRRSENGQVFGPGQRLSRIEALRAVTAIPAYLNFEENKSGTLEAGKFADFVVIDRDYLKCPEEEIRGIKVLRTVVGGKTVFLR
ncbi:MAG: amidohydrolase [Verrucomicrobia bacterium]|nr:amidohydrolase [Verrucomicrobiota bacterium]